MNNKWYENRDMLIAAVEEYGSIEAAALAIGGASVSTVQKAWKRLGLPRRPRGPQPKAPNREALARLHARIYG